MTCLTELPRYLRATPPAYLTRPLARVQPVLATTQGQPNIDLPALARVLDGIAELAEPVAIQSPAHWDAVIRGLGPDVDAILPISISAYPTEIWNSHPQPLIDRGLPLVFWSILQYDEPDFWRWSCTDFLTALGVTIHNVRHNAHGIALLRALALKRLLADSRLVVFGEQNFPWNATAGGHLITQSLGTRILVHPLAAFRDRYPSFSDAEVARVWAERKGTRYREANVRPADLMQAVRTYLAIQSVLEEERALGFGVNCFGDLITGGGRDVPCLAQTLLREDGYIAACDGDYLAMMSMALTAFFLDKPCMMSNMYPVRYVGALTDHFGDPLSPPARYPQADWPQMARLAHCGFAGVVSPEMTPDGAVAVHDWGGTYEMKRDGRGCGIDGALASGEHITVIELKFDGKTLLVADGEVCETTRHADMPHCEASALLKFRNLPGFIEQISREHTVIVYGHHLQDYQALASVLGLDYREF